MIAALPLMLLLGCVAATGQQKLESGPGRTDWHTLRVVNNTPHDLVVYIGPNHQRLGRVGSLTTGCLKWRGGQGTVGIYARVFALGLPIYAPPFQVEESPGWTWKVNHVHVDNQIDFAPASMCGRKLA